MSATSEAQGRTYRALRKMKGLSQEAVATELGVTQPRISQVENGDVPDEHDERYKQMLDRGVLDSLLALGEFEPGDALRYALGLLDRDDLVKVLMPVWLFGNRDLADAAARLLLELGLRQVVVVPLWPSFAGERDAVLVDAGSHDVLRRRVLDYIRDAAALVVDEA